MRSEPIAHPAEGDALGRQFVTLEDYEPGIDVIVKLEGLNPAGSIKLKTARALIRDAEATGRLRKGIRVIESTSGNMGVALATICAAKGYPLTLVIDPNANQYSVRYMTALGAQILTVDDRDPNGGFLQGRVNLIKSLVATDPNLLWLNQYENTANMQAHQDTTGSEILTSIDHVDWLFIGTGTSGTLMGCVAAFRGAGSTAEIVAVDADGSVTFGGAAKARRIPGLGASRVPELFVDTGEFRKVAVSEPDTIRVCRDVARRYGLVFGGSTGTCLAAVSSMVESIHPGSTIVVVSPDMGGAYLDSIYHDDWVEEIYGPDVLASLVLPAREGAAR